MTELPQTPKARAERAQQVAQSFDRRFSATAERFRSALTSWYGDEGGQKARYAEVFEVCEYGRQPTRDELRELFPFLPAQ